MVEEKLLGIKESPDEIFVSLASGKERIDGFGLFAFLGWSGCREGLVLFPLQIGEGGGEFFGSGWAGQGVEVKLGEEGLGLGLLLFCEMSGS